MALGHVVAIVTALIAMGLKLLIHIDNRLATVLILFGIGAGIVIEGIES